MVSEGRSTAGTTGAAGLLLGGAIVASVSLPQHCFVAPPRHPTSIGPRTSKLPTVSNADSELPFSQAQSSELTGHGTVLLLAASLGLVGGVTKRLAFGGPSYSSGGGGRGGYVDPERAKQKAERDTAMYQSYRDRLVVNGGAPPRDEYFWKREEKEVFGGLKMTSGIDFSKYASVEVDRTGGLGEEEPVESFKQLIEVYSVPEGLVANIDRCGYNVPTPVQKHSMPASMLGTDVMVAAQTGSGKTAAFLVPLITRVINAGIKPLEKGPCKPIGIVLAPTRELCVQIAVEARKLTFRTDIRVVSIYGGADTTSQLRSMAEGAQLTIATPGRLEDFLQRGVIRMDDVRYLVVDEADRMLDMGFEPAIRSIIEKYGMPPPGRDEESRQTMMFSATFPKEMQDMALDFLDPTYMWIGVGRVGAANESVEQRFEDCGTFGEREKMNLLMKKLPEVKDASGDMTRTVVFCNTKSGADNIVFQLKDKGIKSMAVHGGLSQWDRERAIAEFRDGKIRTLVATDVAARGLDLPNVGHVVNFDMPGSAEDYVHRIGRTGRIGNKGISTSFVSEGDGSVKDVVQALVDSKAHVPAWLEEASRRSGGSRRRF